MAQRAPNNRSTVQALPPVERLSDADAEMLAAFHEEYASKRREMEVAERCLAILGGQFTKRYNLTPHDLVEPDGTIRRGALLREPLAPHIPDLPVAGGDGDADEG